MSRFDYFVILADRRTGSNFLEANVNAIDGLTCHGEAFNPNFTGYPNRKAILDIDKLSRDAAPAQLIEAMISADGMHGFRYFPSHDPRILHDMLLNPRCAKIILSRDALESFVSLEIARETNQWKLTDPSRRRATQITFQLPAYQRHLSMLRSFQKDVSRAIQRSGQTAFYVNYEDLQDIDVLNGLASFLEVDGRLAELDVSLKRQNPEPLSQKVRNYEEMQRLLTELRTHSDDPNLSAPSVTAAVSPLAFIPIEGCPAEAVMAWLAGLDDRTIDALSKLSTISDLLDWAAQTNGHRTFCVLRHPVARAYSLFMNEEPNRADHSTDAFIAFLDTVAGCHIDQVASIARYSQSLPLQFIAREDSLADDFAILAAQVGQHEMPPVPDGTNPYEQKLSEIYSPKIEAAVRRVFERDYVAFGFGDYAA